jgi:class 3 adenylate cyclase/tetratricopeptide (TPR) repeat protein
VEGHPDQLDADGWDDPEAYLAGDRRRALAAGTPMPDRVSGAALFADLSGFTPLTEAMHAEYGHTRGAEQLTATLGVVFDAVLGELHRHGGSVVYFSGDAVTCWLDADDGHVAAACAQAMQRVMADVADVALPSGRTFQIGLKVAVAVGRARRFVVGDPDIQLIDVLAGRLIDDLAAAESVAAQGDVVLDQSALLALGDDAVVGERRERAGRRFGVLESMTVTVPLPEVVERTARLRDDQVRPWLLPPVWERLRTGHGEFLAELRPAIPVFVRFGGLDFDDDPDVQERLDEFVVGAQRIIHSYGGAALQLTLGDKGAYLYAVFGSPLAHEDDAARACAAALELLALEARTAAIDLQIGIAQGRLRSGTYGHATRRTFCCLGDAVNLAARLMTAAAPGRIVVADAVQRAAGTGFEWHRLPDLVVKGKRDPVPASELNGRRAGGGRRRHDSAMVGRQKEVQHIAGLVARAATGRGQVIGVCAEPGVGKSRLLAEVAAGYPAHGLTPYQGDAQPFGARTSYFAWRTVWTELLGVPDAAPQRQLQSVSDQLMNLAPGLVPRLPLLGAVLGVELPESDLTRSFDAKLRKTSLESLLAELLRVIVRDRGPAVIVLEDCHWLDPLSADLVEVIARLVAELPVAVVLAYRPMEASERTWLDTIAGLPHWTEVELDELDDDAARTVIGAEAARVFELGGAAPASLVERVLARSGGNPFHIQELVAYLKEQGVDPSDEVAVAAVDVPESLHALVLSRIDMLAERVRRTAKVGSVIGRVFDLRTVTGAYPAVGALDEVADDVGVLQRHDLVVPDDIGADVVGHGELQPDPEPPHDIATDGWLFRHAVVRDVAYNSLPFALRADLHAGIARWFEHDPVLAEAGRRRLDLLAHHYWFSDDVIKKRQYLTLAGDAAAADYANAVALEHYRRASELGTDAERGDVLVKLGRVQELVGEWAAAESSYREAQGLLETGEESVAIGAALTALADVLRKQGRYDEAADGLQAAEREFSAVGDDSGVGRVLHLAGTLAAQQGRYADARAKYEASMEIRRRVGDTASEAALLSNLAVVAEYEGNYAAARTLNEQSLELRRTVGDRWALGVSHNNLGMVALLQNDLDDAREQFGEALRLNLEVGDGWMVAIARNNLANTELRRGDLAAAGPHFEQALTAYRLVDDGWALAILYEDVAGLAMATGDPADAQVLAGAADALRTRLGSPRSATQESELADTLASADLDPGDIRRLRAEGRVLESDLIDSLVRQVCETKGERY